MKVGVFLPTALKSLAIVYLGMSGLVQINGPFHASASRTRECTQKFGATLLHLHQSRHAQIHDRQLFNAVGKKTPTFIRFSTVGGEKGSADTERDPRGFALKFYTEEGNWDMTGNNTPVFFIRDPLKFGDFIHTQKRDPETNLKSPTMMWDFWSLSPESLHQVTILFSDRGTPDGLPPHGRLQQPRLQPHQRQKRTLLREVAFQEQAGHQEFHARIR